MTLSVAIGVSMLVSLTTTPMMCAWLLRHRKGEAHGRLYRFGEWVFESVLALYRVTLGWVLRFRFLTLLVLVSTIATTVYLYVIVPKGFFPQQDTGRLVGSIVADQDISFQSMKALTTEFSAAVGKDTVAIRRLDAATISAARRR